MLTFQRALLAPVQMRLAALPETTSVIALFPLPLVPSPKCGAKTERVPVGKFTTGFVPKVSVPIEPALVVVPGINTPVAAKDTLPTEPVPARVPPALTVTVPGTEP